jgi:hypothetical protein
MKKLLLTLILAAVSSSSMAEWVEVGSNDYYDGSIEVTAYADPTSIRKVGDIVKMRSRVDYKPIEMVDGKKQWSIIAKAISVEWSQGESDCKNRQFRAEISYDWTPVTPDSIDDKLWKYACGK